VSVELRLLLDDDQLAAIAALVPVPEPTAEPWPEWMSAETAARYLDVSVERVRKLQGRREIPYYQEGPNCRVFFHRPELDECMRRFRVDARGGGA
jgi:hypothetical protein